LYFICEPTSKSFIDDGINLPNTAILRHRFAEQLLNISVRPFSTIKIWMWSFVELLQLSGRWLGTPFHCRLLHSHEILSREIGLRQKRFPEKLVHKTWLLQNCACGTHESAEKHE
jgi:hypothetical protein